MDIIFLFTSMYKFNTCVCEMIHGNSVTIKTCLEYYYIVYWSMIVLSLFYIALQLLMRLRMDDNQYTWFTICMIVTGVQCIIDDFNRLDTIHTKIILYAHMVW